jgi:hypothetical protein
VTRNSPKVPTVGVGDKMTTMDLATPLEVCVGKGREYDAREGGSAENTGTPNIPVRRCSCASLRPQHCLHGLRYSLEGCACT